MSDLRCVMILNSALPAGKATNAAAVIALTLGQRHPSLVGEDLEDATTQRYPGLIPVGIPVLGADSAQLSTVWRQSEQTDCDIVVFPEQGQSTTDYQAFSDTMKTLPAPEWRLLGMAIVGDKKAVRKLTAKLNLFS
ncbi:hypothetical protein C7434_0628 [Pantoea sp. PNA 14-12]|uniref:DUF2000 domain-containing protein n=1 Tax=Pantoea stewartii TaxID=66269 RepID=A0AB34VHR9_9GAMM|nr:MULTISPECIES: DUF2000 domain-containing protein [Pantoea]KGD85078.1 hypothetical protein HA47_02350 [Pantoea stewartii subsp. indologenes]KTS75594.1 hypothetical protein RSA30_02070 [Pantoea stewartii]KTS99587.1 hypothetical protein RSA13_05535 [Pantoea stewartii]KTT07519.1 hypothetical protein RSA36_12230 [Pantoea stewartii]TDS71842.1 hypothetical protein C7434_0628 [Pantoea sp. PNA 14-12]